MVGQSFCHLLFCYKSGQVLAVAIIILFQSQNLMHMKENFFNLLPALFTQTVSQMLPLFHT